MTPKAVLFDALGTLVELEPPVPRLCAELEKQSGVGITPEEAGEALAAEISYYRAHLNEGRDRATLAKLRRKCTEVLRDALPPHAREVELGALQAILLDALSFRAFPDAGPAIEAVREMGARGAVVSNWDVALEEVLERLGLAPLLDVVITSAGTGARKPSPAIFARALRRLDISAARAVHVGDSVDEDVAGARLAGIEPILIRRDGLPGPTGVRTLAELSALPEALRSL